MAFLPNVPTATALAVALVTTLWSQSQFCPNVADMPLSLLVAHVGVGAVALVGVVVTIVATVRQRLGSRRRRGEKQHDG